MNISKSLFNLVKYNNGAFKSEKQSAFLNSKAVDGSVYHTENYSFGEFNGCTRSIQWQFELSATGVEKVVKISKGGALTEIYWENTEESKSAMNVKANKSINNRKIANRINNLSKWFNRSADRLDNIETQIKAIMMAKIMKGEIKGSDDQLMVEFKNKVDRVENMKVQLRENYNNKYTELENLMIK